MVSHLSNGALRASLTSIARVHCPVPVSVASPRSRLAPCQPRAYWTHQSDPYSRWAVGHAISSLSPSSSPLRRPSLCSSRSSTCAGARSYATTSEPQLPKEIAVLGGGLTGLTTAFYLTRFAPNAKITIYEAADRIGGWIDTEHIEVKTQEGKNATISLERGARVVTPQSAQAKWEDFVLWDLFDQLGLSGHPNGPYALPKKDSILGNRYVYFPDRLVQFPRPPENKSGLAKLLAFASMGFQALTAPPFKGLIRAGWTIGAKQYAMETKTKQNSKAYERVLAHGSERIAMADHEDVSAGEFFEDLVGGKDIVNNVTSALYHGIWGGDVWKLSAAETTTQQAFLQLQHYGFGTPAVKTHDYDSGRDIVARNPAVPQVMQRYGLGQIGYVGFHNGFSTMTDALADALRSNPNVTVKTNAPITGIRYENVDGKATVTSSTGGDHKYDKVISSLYSGTLAKLTADALPALKNSTAVTIQIVNLWYPNPNLTGRTPGFGYLIPQSVPAQNNPHAALGVIFDSDREAAAASPEYISAPGTKLTVMLGGHYWDHLSPGSWPDADEAAAMAVNTVERQLGIPASEPVFTSTKVCRECIPQHLVGHRARMAQAHTELYDAFRGTLAVVGSSYTSPGVLPNLKAARDIALKVAGQGYKQDDAGTMSAMTHVGETGLGRFHGKNEAFRFLPRRKLPFRGNMSKKTFDMRM